MTSKNTLRILAALAALALAACSSSSGSSGSSGTSGAVQGPPAPASITITAASKSEIDVSWTASTKSGVTYSLQRVDADGNKVAVGDNLTVTTASDTTIDAFTDYTYQVQAVDSTGASAFTATSHPAGPPPAGFTNPAPTPSSVDPAKFGGDISIAPDKNGDVALSYTSRDPNQDGDESDDEVYFVSWNRKDFVWNAPIRVAVSGAASTNQRGTALAHDDASDTFVLVYSGSTSPSANKTLTVATSTDTGATWTTRGTISVSGVDVDEPALAVHAGTANLGLFVSDSNGSGVHFRTGSITADPSTWTDATAPLLATTGPGNETPLALALDSAGTPAMAYWLYSTADSSADLAYWRPGGASATQAAQTQPDTGDLDVSLAFGGTQPRIAMIAELSSSTDADGNLDYAWFTSSSDGTTWGAPVVIPNDRTEDMEPSISLAIGSAGQGAVVAEENTSGGGQVCGNPKLATSTNLSSWTTCSPDTSNTLEVTGGFTTYQIVRFGGHDKIDVAFVNSGGTSDPNALAGGVFLWHQ